MKNSFIILNKENGMTSNQALGKIKYLLQEKKAGFVGTLDPFAEGLLVIALNKATRFVDYLHDYDKEYVATLKLGIETDTLDYTGNILNEVEYKNDVSIEMINDVLKNFIGEIDQIPPKYSALKVNGKRAYELARENIDFELKKRKVNIREIRLISFENGELTFSALCSKGTYIRTLGADIANALGYPGMLNKLTRTKVGHINLEHANTIKDIEEGKFKLHSIDSILLAKRTQIKDNEDLIKINFANTLILDKTYPIQHLYRNFIHIATYVKNKDNFKPVYTNFEDKVSFQGIDNIQTMDGGTLCIGGFNCIHKGHMNLIKKASESHYKKIILFDPVPKNFISNNIKNYRIETINQIIRKIKNFFDEIIIVKFNEEVSEISANHFIEIIKSINPENIICGDDFRFGKNAEGDVEKLKEHFHVDSFELDHDKISSSKISDAIKNSNFNKVVDWLGSEFKYNSKIIKGKQLGRKINFPTANFKINDVQCIVEPGVYQSYFYINEIWYESMTNVGYKPTVNGKEITIETNIFNFNENIYNQDCEVSFIKKIRDEIQFDSFDELKAQLINDKKLIKDLFKKQRY